METRAGARFFGGGIFAEEMGKDEDEDAIAELFGDFEESGKDDHKEVEPAEVDTETNRARGIRQPGQPSRKEIEEHNLTHAEFRDWCEVCVSGRGRRDHHRRGTEEAETDVGSMSTYSIDYMYLTENMELIKGEEADRRKLKLGRPILVGHDRKTGGINAHQVPVKGIGDGWPAKRVIMDIEELGYAGTPINLKCDQENPIVAVQRRVMQDRRAPTTPKHSAVGESQSNGAIENAVKRVQGQLRTLKFALEKRMKKVINSEHPAFAWLIEWAATILNRYVKGASGQTPYKMITGKETRRPIAEFGERVLYMKLHNATVLKGKMEERYHQGIWLGLRQKSDEAIIATDRGVVKVKSVRRVIESKRWEAEMFMRMQGTPQQPVPGRLDDHIPTAIDEKPSGEDEHVPETMPDLPAAEPSFDLRAAPAQERAAPRMYVKQSDIDKYGKTLTCPGCDSAGTNRWGRHTDDCRERFRRLMQSDEDGRARLAREQARED